jgi:lysyl-tRNA synthetase class 2
MLPKRFPDRVEIAAVRAQAEQAEPGETLDQEVRVAGRVMARREMGKLTFLDLVDRCGRIQLISEQKVDLDLGDVVGATGKPGRSRRGEPSLVTSQIELLAKIRKPLPDTFHGVTDTETRYRQRYLDLLMNEESRELAATRTKIVAAVRAYLDG